MRVRTHRLALIGVALCAVLAVPARSGADEIRLTIDRPEANLEDQLLITITIEGSMRAQPTLPDMPEFDVQYRGQSVQTSFINGTVSTAVSHSYLLTPRRAGTFTIGPATVQLDDQLLSSESIVVRILEPSEQPQDTRDLFLTARVSSTTPYVGQQVVYVWRFYRRVRIGDARLEPQDFGGFLVEDLGDVREFEATVNGVRYVVSEIRKAIFPQEVGRVELPPSRLTCEIVVRGGRRGSSLIDEFFGTTTTETKVLRSAPISIDVRPLPTPPEEFSGLVGTFEIGAEISKADLKVGESATLKVTIRGAGNVQMISEPALPPIAAFKVYDDRPSGDIDRKGDRLRGSRTFTKALVPMESGELAVPPIRITYFDPDEAEFRSVGTPPIALQVRPADGVEDLQLTESIAPTTGKVAVRILADDLLPIYRGLDAVAVSPFSRMRGWRLAFGWIVPPIAFALLWLFQRRRERFSRDAVLSRRSRALRSARRALHRLERTEDFAEAPRQASKILRRFIGDKLGLEGAALTPAEVLEVLRGRGVAEEVVQATHEWLEMLDTVQFSGGSFQQQSSMRELAALILSLDREIGR